MWTVYRRAATELAEQCLENLYYIQEIKLWKKIKIKVKFRWWALKNHKLPIHDTDVKHQKWWKPFRDRLSFARGLPISAAERAVVDKLLEQYMGYQVSKAEAAEKKAGVLKKEAEAAGSKGKEAKGLRLWCVIHYLYIVKSCERAERYEEALSQEDKEDYFYWREKGLGTPMNYDYLRLEQIMN